MSLAVRSIYIKESNIDYIKAEQHKKNILVVIKRLYLTGSSFQDISSTLNRTCTRTLSGKGKWHRKTVNRLYKESTK